MSTPLRMTFEVACSVEHAFDVWTSGIGTWWPRDHTTTGNAELVVLQSGVGGRIYERGPDGEEHDWGEVTVWEPPSQVTYSWHLGRDRADAGEVDIRFRPGGGGTTRVEIEHRGLGADGGHRRCVARPEPGRMADRDAPFRRGDRERRPMMATGTKDDPWVLKTPPGTSQYTMYKDTEADPPALVCQVGSTTLRYQLRAIEDLHAWLVEQGDWVVLGAADEKKPAAPGTVEAWGRATDNPVGGWYGLRNGYRGRFGMYLPPLLEALGLAELTHEARNNKMRSMGTR